MKPATLMMDWTMLTLYATGPLVTWLTRRHPSLSYHDCEDAAAEALARTWQHRAIVEPERVTTWINAVANRLLIDRERRRRTHPMLPIVDEFTDGLEIIDTAPGPDAVAIANETRVVVVALLSALPLKRARVLWQHHGLGQTFPVIAAEWGTTVGAVRMMAHYGRVEARARRAAMEAA
jgi:RNA polymerase sigma factor (sigma-70 family)